MPALVGTAGRPTDLGETINITQASQLPDPAGGVITLAPNKVYHFHNTVIPAAPLVGSGGTVLKGESRGTSKITIASASPLLGDGFSEISCLTLINTAGPVMTQTLGPTTVFRMRDCIVVNGARGKITTGGPFSAVVLEEIQYQGGYSGVELVGPFALVGLRGVGAAGLTVNPGSPGDPAGRLIELGPNVASAVEIVSCPIFTANANQTGLYVDPTPPAEGGVIILCAFGKPPIGIGLGGVTPDTPGWRTGLNPAIPDATTAGSASFEANTLATTFLDTTTYKLIAHTPAWVAGPANSRVSLQNPSGAGELRIDARIPSKLDITIGVVAEAVSGANYVYEFLLEKVRDGVTTSIGTFRVDQRIDPASKTWKFQIDAEESTGTIYDEYQLKWRNTTSATNAIVLDAFVIVSRA
jgi:hypothetical protein